MSEKLYYDAKEAAERLGVSVSTLYSYVSRGLVRSEAVGDDPRKRRYRAEDIERLLARKEGRRNPEHLARETLHWGMPVLPTALTLISEGSFYYRGQDVIQLAQRHHFEEVVALLWADNMALSALFARQVPPSSPRLQALMPHLDDLSPVDKMQAVLPLAAADDFLAYNLQPDAVMQAGVRIIQLFTSVLGGAVGKVPTIAAALAQGWGCDESAVPLFNAALILCADHELNASAFAARVVASAWSPPYAVVMAGLSALRGAKHGGYTDRVETFLNDVFASDLRTTITDWLRRGERIPGFGHKLYPQGDPRAVLLMALMEQCLPQNAIITQGREIAAAVQDYIGEAVTVDYALVILRRALQLPNGGALALFALGRTAGWIAHALEAYEENRLIRPRARYIGALPPED